MDKTNKQILQERGIMGQQAQRAWDLYTDDQVLGEEAKLEEDDA